MNGTKPPDDTDYTRGFWPSMITLGVLIIGSIILILTQCTGDGERTYLDDRGDVPSGPW